MELPIITLIILGITVLVSYSALQNVSQLNKLMFYPTAIRRNPKEWWRFITHGFIHADYTHLAFNMITLFFFGRNLEYLFGQIFGNPMVYVLFYFAALVFSSIPTYFKHKDNYHYCALGASGAVSAVMFAAIMFDPWQTLRFNFFIPIPAILFAIGYVAYSSYMSKKANDNIGHDAHLWGAVFGILFPLIFKPSIIPFFIQQLQHPRFNP